MQRNSLLLLSLTLCVSAPAPYAQLKAATACEENEKAELYNNIIEQSQQLCEWLSCRQKQEGVSDKDINTLKRDIRSLQSYCTKKSISHNDIVSLLQENRLYAKQLHEIFTDGFITTKSLSIPPHIDVNTPINVLQDVYEATQNLIDDAISHANAIDFQEMAEDAAQFCQDWYLDKAALTAGIAASIGTGYYFWDNITESAASVYNSDAVQKSLAYALAASTITTYAVRYLTPDELDKYPPQPIKPILQAYKQALHKIGFPGNISKDPVVPTASLELPDAQEFKKHAKEQGYHVPEERIPGDCIKLKQWGFDEIALFTTGMKLLKNELNLNDVKGTEGLLSHCVSSILPNANN